MPRIDQLSSAGTTLASDVLLLARYNSSTQQWTDLQTTIGGIVTTPAPLSMKAAPGFGNPTGTVIPAGYLLNSYLIRYGTTAAFTDTTDTAANIVAAIPGTSAGNSFTLRVLNTTGYAMTFTPGSGVTGPGAPFTVAVSQWRDFLMQIAVVSPAAVTMTNVGSGTL